MFKKVVAPEKELKCYEHVVVDSNSGILIDKDGRLVLEQADEAIYWLPETMGRTLRRGADQHVEVESRIKSLEVLARTLRQSKARLKVLDTNFNYIYLLHPFGFFAFGHFYDSIQRLIHCLDKVPEPWKILHSRAGRIVDFEQHMEFLGVPKNRLVQLNEPVVVPNIWVSPWQAHPVDFSEEGYDWLYDRYTSNLKKTEHNRLYLTRNHVRPGERCVLNEEEVVTSLIPHGFEVITGEEPLHMLIQKFHNADMVIGFHGALFGHTMFCNPDTRVVEYCASNRVTRFFVDRQKKVKDYNFVIVEGDEASNIQIPIADMLSFIQG